MYRLLIPLALLFSCTQREGSERAEGPAGLQAQFPEGELPYTLADTAAAARPKGDTVEGFPAGSIPDSIRAKFVSGKGRLRLYPLVRMDAGDGETYFILQAAGNRARGALIAAYSGDSLGAVGTFLLPDADPATVQTASVDKALNISRSANRVQDGGVTAEGRDVYVYNKDAGRFTLIQTDALDERAGELINPVDTLPRTHPLAGDYGNGKRNLVSIRDGRDYRSLMAFVHFQTDDGSCYGELKGELLLTGENTALYRRAGDPCVLQFRFGKNEVTLIEEEGCGSRRGINCSFNQMYRKRSSQPTVDRPR